MKKLIEMMKGNREIDITRDDVKTSLLYLTIPIVLINLLRMAYNMADTFWLSKLSKEAIAAVTFSFPVVYLMISMGIGVSIAGSILVAKYRGRMESEMVEYTASQTLVFSLIVASVMGIITFFNIERILVILGASGEALPLAVSYLRVISLGVFSLFGFSVFISLMRGYGDTVTPMLVMLVSVVLNVLLDPVFIFGLGPVPAMGIKGAAVATVLCRGIAMLIGVYIMFSGVKGLRIRLKYLVPDFGFFRQMFSVGLPASIEVMAESICVNALIAIVGQFSNSVVAGYGIGSKIYSLVFLPAMAASRGISTLTGQNIGANKSYRAEQANIMAARFIFLLLTVSGVGVFFGAERLIMVFNSEPEVVSAGAQFLRYIAVSFGFTGIWASFNGGFRGAGKTLMAASITLISMAVVRVPVAFFASEYMGVKGIWIGFIVSNIVGGLLALYMFWRGRWLDMTV